VTGGTKSPSPPPSYYRARYYDQTVGRFASGDPLRFGGGDNNFYSYVGQNPLNYADPSGLIPIHAYGYWCGPDWTGGLEEEYNPYHAELPQRRPMGRYRPPKPGGVDVVCMHHDNCYYNCRRDHPCDRGERANCMTKCDQIFVAEMPLGQGRGTLGIIGDALSAAIFWHQFFPGPGPNSGSCCKTSKAPPQPKPCAGVWCLDNR